MDCFNHSCPFRVNETSNANRCECVACQNRSNNDFIITSNRTLTNDELAMLNAQRSGDKNYGVGNWCQEMLTDECQGKAGGVATSSGYCGQHKRKWTQHREFIADLMIANGVTVQEWISVDDMLPENGKEDVLIALRWGEIDIGGYEDGRWRSEFVNEYEDGEVTNWMPLPQLPKGE